MQIRLPDACVRSTECRFRLKAQREVLFVRRDAGSAHAISFELCQAGGSSAAQCPQCLQPPPAVLQNFFSFPGLTTIR